MEYQRVGVKGLWEFFVLEIAASWLDLQVQGLLGSLWELDLSLLLLVRFAARFPGKQPKHE